MPVGVKRMWWLSRFIPDKTNPRQCRKQSRGSWVRLGSDARGTGAASGGAGSTLPGGARGRLSQCGPRTRHIDACCGGRECSTIRCLVYSRVVFVLVLQTRVSIQSGRSCFSICREPQLDAGHHLASQQRWCDESYHPAHLRGLPKPSGHEPKHGLCQVIWVYHLLRLHPLHPIHSTG